MLICSYIKLKKTGLIIKKISVSWSNKSGATLFEKNSKQLLKKYDIRYLNIIEIFCRSKKVYLDTIQENSIISLRNEME